MELLAEKEARSSSLEEAGGDHLRVVGGRADRLVQGRVGAADLYGDVGPPVLAQAFYLLGGVDLVEVQNVSNPELAGELQALRDAVDGDHGAAVQRGELGGDEARHPLAEDRDVLADVHVRIQHGVQGYRADPGEDPDQGIHGGGEPAGRGPPLVDHRVAPVAPGAVDDVAGLDLHHSGADLRDLADLLVAPP